MNHTLCRVLVSMAVLAAPALPRAAEKDPAAEATVALVHKAAVYIKAHGKEQALAEFRQPTGPFASPDFFVYDTAANRLVHGNNPRMIGKNLDGLKDSQGKLIMQSFKDMAASQGAGWVEYQWPNPATGRMGTRASYVEQAGELLLGSGVFKN